ncbi:hypothetical protein NC651_040489 [Populus alba x Populus x berolinensis]|nr:hypothetical protein NC651_040489 [Populus alba x Populus x berolinensis]
MPRRHHLLPFTEVESSNARAKKSCRSMLQFSLLCSGAMYLFIRENLLGGSYITMILMDLTEVI